MKINRRLPWRKRCRQGRNAVLAAPFFLLGGVKRVARWQAGRFQISRQTWVLPQLPAEWSGVTITHLTDLHIGPAFSVEHHLPPLLAACDALASDLVLVTGDWVDRRSCYLSPALPLLRQLSAPLGVYGCLGNHDLFDTRWECIRQLRSVLGENLLINRAVTLRRNGASLLLAGTDYAETAAHHRRHMTTLGRQLPRQKGAEFILVMAHDPTPFPELVRLGADVVLSGHTHGGQISLTAAPRPVVGPAMFRFPYLRGVYRCGPAWLYVNRGLSQSLPIRWNNPPEIAQIRLMNC